MAIPDTSGGWGLEDVRVELALGPTASLQDCFTNANAGSFDATYEGSKDRLSNFRNYGAVSLTGMYITSISYTTSAGACGQTVTQLVYHDGAGTFPAANDFVYTDSGGTTVFVGGGDHYGQDIVDNDPASTTSQIASNGRVSNPQVCL